MAVRLVMCEGGMGGGGGSYNSPPIRLALVRFYVRPHLDLMDPRSASCYSLPLLPPLPRLCLPATRPPLPRSAPSPAQSSTGGNVTSEVSLLLLMGCWQRRGGRSSGGEPREATGQRHAHTHSCPPTPKLFGRLLDSTGNPTTLLRWPSSSHGCRLDTSARKKAEANSRAAHLEHLLQFCFFHKCPLLDVQDLARFI